MNPIYLDHHATTPLDPRVLESMLPCLQQPGNASSRHYAGRWAHGLVEQARASVAALLYCEPDEVTFTSGATESNNIALQGILRGGPGAKLITVATEHSSVLQAAQQLAKRGLQLEVLPVEASGRLSTEQLAPNLEGETSVVSVMAANNEIGVTHPIQEIASLCRYRKVLFHTDATQALLGAREQLRDNYDLLSCSAHKIYGPQGVGALVVRRRSKRTKVAPLAWGGGHEKGLRPGTLNLAGIVGFGKACELLMSSDSHKEHQRIATLRDLLLTALQSGIPGLTVNGTLEHRIPGNLNVQIPGVFTEALLHSLPAIAASTGSACGSNKHEPSHVLLALGVGPDKALQSIRFGLGRHTTEAQIREAAEAIVAEVRRIQALNLAAVI